jgi:hypothetical protein
MNLGPNMGIDDLLTSGTLFNERKGGMIGIGRSLQTDISAGNHTLLFRKENNYAKYSGTPDARFNKTINFSVKRQHALNHHNRSGFRHSLYFVW